MTDFEHDDELRAALQRAHPTSNEARPVLAANRARMARARSRRRATIASLTVASVAVVGVALLAANGANDDTNTINVVASPTTSVVVTTTTPEEPSTTTTASDTVSTTRVASGPPTTTAPATAPATAPTVTSSTPTTTATVSPPSTSAAGTRQTFVGRAGSITITWTASAITVETVTDEAGWTHTVQNKGDDVEVEWQRNNPQDDTKTRLRLKDGDVSEEID